MEKNLSVPYKSQHTSDSAVSNNDCGPASLAMVMEFLGQPHSVGGVLKKLGNPTGFTTISQLAAVAERQGFNTESKVDATFSQLKSYIDKGLPVIVVGGYRYLTSTQDKKFKDSHIMVVVGYRDDDSVYVNDPNFYGEFVKDGDHHVYTFEEFNNFWRNDNNREGNKPNILFVVSPKVTPGTTPQVLKVKVSSKKGVNQREKPNTSSTVLSTIKQEVELEVVTQVEGEKVSGNNIWYQIKDGGFVWSGGTEKLAVSVPEQTAKNEEEKPSIDPPYLDNIKAIYELSRQVLESYKALPDQETKQASFWERLRGKLKLL